MAPEKWKIVSSKTEKSYRVFSLRTDHAVSPRTGLSHDFFILESSAWVNIIPLTQENEVVLVQQYRHGTREVTIEIPGGLVEPGDTPESAASRELREETGYREEEMVYLGRVQPNPAIQNNWCYTYLARNVFPVGDLQQDEKEDIEVITRPVADIPRMIREGAIAHALVVAAFYRFFMEFRA